MEKSNKNRWFIVTHNKNVIGMYNTYLEVTRDLLQYNELIVLPKESIIQVVEIQAPNIVTSEFAGAV